MEITQQGKRLKHVVLLYEGLIIDWDATIWEPDEFKATYDAKFGELLFKP